MKTTTITVIAIVLGIKTAMPVLVTTPAIAGVCDIKDFRGDLWGGVAPDAPVVQSMRRQLQRMRTENWGGPRYVADLEAQIAKLTRPSGETDCPSISYREFTKDEIDANPNLRVGLNINGVFLFPDDGTSINTLEPAEYDLDFTSGYDFDPADMNPAP
jgi:hypothetical protein